MTRLFVSANNRGVSSDMPSGGFYVVDLEHLKILRKTSGIEPPFRRNDPNPRGGMRGMRGMSFHGDEIAVANYSAIFIFDCHWKLLRTFTHPSVSAIHEIFYTDDGIWVTSAVNDLLVRFDPDGKLVELDYIRSHQNLMLRLRGPLRQILNKADIPDGGIDFRSQTQYITDDFDRTHLNGIEILPDGGMLISLGRIVGDVYASLVGIKTLMQRLGMWTTFLSLNRWLSGLFGLKKKMLSELVAQPSMGTSAVIKGHPKAGWQIHLQLRVAQNPGHSPRILDDDTGLYLDSSQGRLVHFDQEGNILSNPVITEKFLRGLLILPNGHLAIGASNTLLIYDRTKQEVLSQLELAENANTSIFDIKILPENFNLPPESFETKFGHIVGFDGSKSIWDRDS